MWCSSVVKVNDVTAAYDVSAIAALGDRFQTKADAMLATLHFCTDTAGSVALRV